jgi:hypothetical protein
MTLLGLDGARARLDAVARDLDAALASLTGRGNDNGLALADLAVMAVRRSR